MRPAQKSTTLERLGTSNIQVRQEAEPFYPGPGFPPGEREEIEAYNDRPSAGQHLDGFVVVEVNNPIGVLVSVSDKKPAK